MMMACRLQWIAHPPILGVLAKLMLQVLLLLAGYMTWFVSKCKLLRLSVIVAEWTLCMCILLPVQMIHGNEPWLMN